VNDGSEVEEACEWLWPAVARREVPPFSAIDADEDADDAEAKSSGSTARPEAMRPAIWEARTIKDSGTPAATAHDKPKLRLLTPGFSLYL
jgi:hypothetical protein